MQNMIQIFENTEFGKLEVLMIDGKPFFPASECAEMLGYKRARDAVLRHCPHAVKYGVGVQTGVKADGSPAYQTIDKTYIPEGDLYRLIIRSKLPAALRFEAWVCDTVLPSIRKHGAYISSDILRRMREDNKYADDLLRRLAAECEKNSELLDHIERLAPKANYFDVMLRCPEAVQVSVIAKDYGMSAVAFNKLLRKLGLQYKMGKTWLLYQKYAGKGYTITNTYAVNGKVTSIHTCFTQRGRCWLYHMLKNHGILPEVERTAGG